MMAACLSQLPCQCAVDIVQLGETQARISGGWWAPSPSKRLSKRWAQHCRFRPHHHLQNQENCTSTILSGPCLELGPCASSHTVGPCLATSESAILEPAVSVDNWVVGSQYYMLIR